MEAGNGLRQSIRRKICQHSLEITESHRTLIKVLWIFYFFQCICIFYKMICSPVLSKTVYKIRFT